MTCSSSIFLVNLLLLLSSVNSPNILQWPRTVPVFFQTIKISLFSIFEKHYDILIIVKIAAKKVFLSFVLTWRCLVSYVPLHCRHPNQNRNHLMSTWLHLSFENRISFHHFWNLIFCGVFKISNCPNSLLPITFRVLLV